MEHSIPIEEAQRHFPDLLKRAEQQGESTLLTRSGVPVACVIPFTKRLRTGQELAELLEQRPHLLPGDAEEWEMELQEIRSKLRLPVSKWE